MRGPEGDGETIGAGRGCQDDRLRSTRRLGAGAASASSASRVAFCGWTVLFSGLADSHSLQGEAGALWGPAGRWTEGAVCQRGGWARATLGARFRRHALREGGGGGRRHGRDGTGTAENRPPELLTLTCGLTSRLSDADARPGWAHSHPRHPLPLAPSSPSPGPGRPLLCLLSLSGCRSGLPLSLGFLVYKVLCAKRLARCLEQSKRSVPATNSVRSFLH